MHYRPAGVIGVSLGLALAVPGAASAQPPAPTSTQQPAAAPQASPAAPAAASPAGGFGEWRRRVKQPASWFKWGADLRLRNEILDNASTLSSALPRHEQDYYRMRPRLFATLTPVGSVDVNVRLTFESRYWNEPSSSRPFHEGWDWNELVFDHANLRWKNVAGRPLTLTIGRQDLGFGDNWLVFEGTPLDGSRTIYFDAARASYEWKARKTTLDVVYVDQGARNDRWLPPVRLAGDAVEGVDLPIEKAQIEHDERGLVLYLSNKSRAKANVDGYFVYKRTRRDEIRGTDDANLKANLQRGDDADLYTLGARVAGTLSAAWRYRAEGAFQTGERNEVTSRGVGWNSALVFAPRAKASPELRLAYEFLSGDDPLSGDTNEAFDVLWGRWPRWSELYIYSYAPESRISQLGNLHRLGPGFTLKPSKKVDLNADFYLLYADEIPVASTLLSGEGRFRGKLLASNLKARFSPSVSGHLWAELLYPGDFYFGGDATNPARRDRASFLRAELLLSW